MKIDRITLTGADDYTELRDLRTISSRYPFVEWGLLFAKSQGRPRYPSEGWINKVLDYQKKAFEPLQLSAHLCGQYAEDLLNGKTSILYTLKHGFNRVQINFNFQTNKKFSLACLCEVLTIYPAIDFVIQAHHGNMFVIDYLIDKGFTNVHYLYDSSGGRGKFIGDILPVFPTYTGYAGGLSPANIFMLQQKLYDFKDDTKVWLDMETGVRTEDRFDLQKCTRVLKTIELGNY